VRVVVVERRFHLFFGALHDGEVGKVDAHCVSEGDEPGMR
jgi:hypothetical protein